MTEQRLWLVWFKTEAETCTARPNMAELPELESYSSWKSSETNRDKTCRSMFSWSGKQQTRRQPLRLTSCSEGYANACGHSTVSTDSQFPSCRHYRSTSAHSRGSLFRMLR